MSGCPSSPEDEEFNMALHTEIARELTGTGNTGEREKGGGEEVKVLENERVRNRE